MPQLDINSKTLLSDFFNKVYETNENFSNNHGHDFFNNFKDRQNPYMTILKCSDSRVQMESFDRTPQNGVFAIRNIGNQLLTCEGSVDYGVRVLKTPILFIIGHSGCGAVDAVVSKNNGNVLPVPVAVNKELESLKINCNTLSLAVIENINEQVNIATSKYRDLIDAKSLAIIGAVYDFKNDYGFGKGKIVFVSVNGIRDEKIVRGYIGPNLKNINFYTGS